MSSLRECLGTGLVTFVFCITSLGVGASAQTVVQDGIANCVWLKVTAKGSGFETLENAAGLGPRRSINAPCYMQLVFMPADAQHPHGRYEAPILCPIDAATWAPSSMDASFLGTALADGNVIAVDDYLSFTNDSGDVVQGYGTHRLLITIDKKTGAFKSAIFTTLGAEMIDNSIFFESFAPVIGSYTTKGNSMPAEKVPLEAKALVAGGPCP